MADVMDFEEVLENYYDGVDLDQYEYGVSVYSEDQLDWALEESR